MKMTMLLLVHTRWTVTSATLFLILKRTPESPRLVYAVLAIVLEASLVCFCCSCDDLNWASQVRHRHNFKLNSPVSQRVTCFSSVGSCSSLNHTLRHSAVAQMIHLHQAWASAGLSWAGEEEEYARPCGLNLSA